MTNAMAAATASEILTSRFLGENALRLAPRHYRHFVWLVERLGAPILWSDQRRLPQSSRFVVVIEPPSGPRADDLYRAIDESCVVVIPFGENPGFDFLKSKLKDFGSIGAAPEDGPHQLWWGGLKWGRSLAACQELHQPLIVSCYPRGGVVDAQSLKHSVEALHLDAIIEPVKTASPDKLHGAEKAAFIRRIWASQRGPVLWVEPDSRFEVYPSLITKVDFDFAVHRWNRWEISSRTIGVGQSAAAEQLLDVWHQFAFNYPKVWDGYVLDQAWSLVTSQVPLHTVWLPRSYHATRDKLDPRFKSVVINNLDASLQDLGAEQGFPKSLRPARRASRIGPPEASVVLTSPHNNHGAVSVILSDIQSSTAREVAGTVDAIVDAFKVDPAGFGRLELSLCSWSQDVERTAAVARHANNRVLKIRPSMTPANDLFRRFVNADEAHLNVVPLPVGAQSLP